MRNLYASVDATSHVVEMPLTGSSKRCSTYVLRSHKLLEEWVRSIQGALSGLSNWLILSHYYSIEQ
jgi:hypothetical protein